MFQTENLQEKWSPVLAHPDLPKIEDSYKRAVTTLILENQEKALKEDRNFLSEAAPTNQTGTAVDNCSDYSSSVYWNSCSSRCRYYNARYYS